MVWDSECEEGDLITLPELLKEFKKLYENLLEAKRGGKLPQNTVYNGILKKWLQDLSQQNKLLVSAFKHLEMAGNDIVCRTELEKNNDHTIDCSKNTEKNCEELEKLNNECLLQREKIIDLKNKVCDINEKTKLYKGIALDGGFENENSLDNILNKVEDTKEQIDKNIIAKRLLTSDLAKAKHELMKLQKKKKNSQDRSLKTLKKQRNLFFAILNKREELSKAREMTDLALNEKNSLLETLKSKLVYSDSTLSYFHDLFKRVFCAVEKWENASKRLTKFQSFYDYLKLVVHHLEPITREYPCLANVYCNDSQIGEKNANKKSVSKNNMLKRLTENELRCVLRKKLCEITRLQNEMHYPPDLECVHLQQRSALLNILDREIQVFKLYLAKDHDIEKFINCTNYLL